MGSFFSLFDQINNVLKVFNWIVEHCVLTLKTLEIRAKRAYTQLGKYMWVLMKWKKWFSRQIFRFLFTRKKMIAFSRMIILCSWRKGDRIRGNSRILSPPMSTRLQISLDLIVPKLIRIKSFTLEISLESQWISLTIKTQELRRQAVFLIIPLEQSLRVINYNKIVSWLKKARYTPSMMRKLLQLLEERSQTVVQKDNLAIRQL